MRSDGAFQRSCFNVVRRSAAVSFQDRRGAADYVKTPALRPLTPPSAFGAGSCIVSPPRVRSHHSSFDPADMVFKVSPSGTCVRCSRPLTAEEVGGLCTTCRSADTARSPGPQSPLSDLETGSFRPYNPDTRSRPAAGPDGPT